MTFLSNALSLAIHRSLAKADYDGAVRRSNTVLYWVPNSAHFTFLRGTVLLFAGRLDEAEVEIRASLAKGSGLAQSARLVNLGYIQMDKGQFHEAIATFQRAAAIFDASGTSWEGGPRRRTTMSPRRWIRWISGSYPGSPERNGFGTALLEMGRKKEALEHFRGAAEADPRGAYGKRCAKAAAEMT